MKKVLFVDDDQINHDIMTIIFNKLKIENVMVKNGLDAINTLEYEHFDLVVTDIRMPVMDGLNLAKKIKHNYQKLPVIALSSEPKSNYQSEQNKYFPFDDFIQKPYKIESIKNMLNHYLETQN